MTDNVEERLKQKYVEMAKLTRPKCGECRCPLSCCSPEYCYLTKSYAEDEWDVELEESGHKNAKNLPFMGPDGCIVEPHLRPLCTIHVCEQHYMKDKHFNDTYFALRAELGGLEWEREKACAANTGK